ncbi:MAG: arsenate reductase ArsC [Anaerolineales bacterium]|nr:arsenate reductase ArsC [Anaerolineales bacterium]
MAPEIKQVLFLCTGNSCRSQMAEAIVNSWPDSSWRAYSAGTAPAGYVHPKAIQVLAETGIHHEGLSKSVDEFRGEKFDLVVTVCDSAAEECPVWLGEGRKVHLGYPDPAKASGSEQHVLEVFRAVRDDLAAGLDHLLGHNVREAS